MRGTATIHLSVFRSIMKTAILVAFFVGIAVAISHKDHETFRPGKQYKYQVRSQSLTGIPHLAEQFSGIRYDVQVTLQLSTGYKATMAFDGVRFFQLNDVIDELPVNRIIKDDKWQLVDSEQRQEYEDCFRQPVTFTYERGLIRNLEVPMAAEWCSNLKKGILSMFQFDLNQQNERVDTSLADILQQNRLNLDRNSDRTFRVMEESIDGECESLYIISDCQKQNKGLDVTKIRNYDNCRFQPRNEEGLFSDYTTDVQNPHNHTNFRSTSRTNCTLSGEQEDFVILSVNQESSQVYTPLAEDMGEIATFSVQEMSFESSRRTENVIQPARYTRPCPEGLKMIISKEEPEQQEGESNNWKVRIIDQLLTEYVAKCTPRVTQEALESLSKLMYSLRDCTSQDIIDVFKSLKEDIDQSQAGQETVQNKKMKTMLDVISTVGRPNIMLVMEFLIENQYVTEIQAATMFNFVALTIKPSASVMEFFMPSSKMYNYPLVHHSAQVRQALILASGTVFHGLQKSQRNEPIPPSIYRDRVNEYIREIQDFYKSAVDESERVAILKAISNSGLPGFFEFLREIIEERSTVPVRVNAVLAMRRMPREMSLKIHNFLLPIFLDSREAQQVRVTAYLVIMRSQPNYGTVHSIMASLYGEQSQQVGDFVYSHLRSIAESSRSSLDETRQFVRVLMKEAEPFISNKYYRNTYSMDMLARDLGIGQYFDLFLTESTRTVFPAGFTSIFGMTLYGKELEILETGMQFTGVEEIVSRLLGPKSFLRELLNDEEKLSEEFLDIVKQLLSPQRKPSMGNVDKFIQDLIQKLGLSQHEPDQFNYIACLKVLGNELGFLELDAKDLVSWLEMNEKKILEQIISFLENLKKGKQLNMMQTISGETSFVVPNLLGIPVYVNESYSHILRLTGNTKLTGNLLGFKSDIKLDTFVQPSIGVMTIGCMGLQLPLHRSGVTVRSTARFQDDFRFTVELNDQPQQLTMKYYVPEKRDTELSYWESVPSTYIHRLYTALKPDVFKCEQKEITNPKFVRPYTMTIPYPSQVFGQTFEHTIVAPTSLVGYAPVRPFNGKHTYTWKRKEVANTNQVVQFQLQFTQQESTQEIYNYRSSSRSVVDLEQFDQVREDSRLQSPVKRVLLTSLMTENTPAPINLRSMITFLRDQDSRKCQINVQVTDESYKAQWNVFADIHKIFNPSPSSEKEEVFKVDVQYQADQEYSASVQLSTGDTGSTVMIPAEPYYIYRVRNVFSSPVRMVSKEQQYQSSWSFFGDESYSSEEISDEEQLKSAKRGLMPFPEFRNHAYKYTMEVNYEQAPEFLQQAVQQYYQQMRDLKRYDVAVMPKDQEQHPGKVNLVFRFQPSMERIHIYVDEPRYDTTFFCAARIPTYLNRALTYNSDLIFNHENKEERKEQAQCLIDDQSPETNVKTFDGMRYELPDMNQDCEILLAKSDQIFTITTSKPEGRRQLTIVLPRKEIKVRVASSWERAQVEDDGEELELENGPKDISIGSKPVAEISKEGNTIRIQSQRLGLNVEVREEQISIKTSVLHSGEVRGICGDYNGETHREMSGPRKQEYRDAKQFVIDYVLPSDTCDVEELRKQHNIQPENDVCSLKKETKVIKTQDNYGEDLTCFSEEEVPRCPRGCRPRREETERKDVMCFQTNSNEARRLLQEVKHRPFNQIRLTGERKYREVNIPTECEPDW